MAPPQHPLHEHPLPRLKPARKPPDFHVLERRHGLRRALLQQLHQQAQDDEEPHHPKEDQQPPQQTSSSLMIDPAHIIEDLKSNIKHCHPYDHRKVLSKLTPEDFKLIVDEVNFNEVSRSNWNDKHWSTSRTSKLYNIEDLTKPRINQWARSFKKPLY